MIKQTQWKKRLAIALTGGFIVLNTAAVLAAPMELSLDDSIALALMNNPIIKIANADTESANWGITAAKGAKLPSVSLSHSDKRSDSPVSYGNPVGGVTDNFSNNVSLSLPIYSGGGIEAQIEQAKLNFKINEVGMDKSRQQVKLDATTGYFSILGAQNSLKVSQESVGMMEDHLKNVQAQYGVGVVAKSDVLRSQVELANYQQKQIIAQNGYDLAVSKFNNTLGLPLDTEVKLKDELKTGTYALTLDDSVKYAMANRPDVAQADYKIDIAKQGIKVAESGKLPKVNFSANQGWSDATFPGTKDQGWSIGLMSTWTPFDSGVTNAKIKQSEASLTKIKLEAQQAKDGYQLEVRQYYLSMNEANKRIGTSQVAVDNAQEDYKIAEVRYSAGVGTNTDVIDTQVALTTAKNNYIQAMYDYNTSKANLGKAMGIAVSGNSK